MWNVFDKCVFVGKQQKIKGRAIKCFLFGLKSWWKEVGSVLAYRQKWPISSDETFYLDEWNVFLRLPFNPSTVSQHTLQIATVVSMQLKLYCWQWRGAKNLITTMLIGKVNLLLTLIYINILDAISWYQGIWNSFVRLSYHVIIRFMIHPRYRVIQETVFYNLSLTDLKNQINCITQWFSGHFDILMSQYNQVTNSCTSWLCQNRHWQEFRSREILEEKWLTVFPLKLERWIFISRSPLDFQDFEKKILFLLSFLKISYWNSLSPLDFQDF